MKFKEGEQIKEKEEDDDDVDSAILRFCNGDSVNDGDDVVEEDDHDDCNIDDLYKLRFL